MPRQNVRRAVTPTCHLLSPPLCIKTLQAKVTADLERRLRQWRLRLPPLLEAWRAWLDDTLRRELSEVSQAQRGMFCEPLRKARERWTRSLHAFQDWLAEHVKAALSVTLTRREFALEVREPSAPPVCLSEAPRMAENLPVTR